MTTPAMDTALGQAFVPDFCAVEILLPSGPIRLLAGGSQVTFPVEDLATGVAENQTFLSEDPTFGTLGGLESVGEGLGTSAPKMRLGLAPPTHAAAALLNQPINQGASVRLWYGVLNYMTGEVIPSPELLFWGFLNQPRFAGGRQNRAVEYDVASALDSLFANSEGQRLNHQTLTKAFPGARGLEYVSDIERNLPWGSNAARSPLISAAGGGYHNGGTTLPPGGGGGGGGGVGGGGMANFNYNIMAR